MEPIFLACFLALGDMEQLGTWAPAACRTSWSEETPVFLQLQSMTPQLLSPSCIVDIPAVPRSLFKAVGAYSSLSTMSDARAREVLGPAAPNLCKAALYHGQAAQTVPGRSVLCQSCCANNGVGEPGTLAVTGRVVTVAVTG